MLIAFLAIVLGLALLVWSADLFVKGSASTARYFGISPLFIGMVIVGFGTSAPEMVVSALSSMEGNPGIALGNAYGSNITNIALILGLTAIISPIVIESKVLYKELPILALVSGIAAWQLWDGELSFTDALVLLGIFSLLLGWTSWQAITKKSDALAEEVEQELETMTMPLKQSVSWLFSGLLLLILSSRVLVWGAVDLAQAFGIDELIIGLTIVAIGTSLPELASSIVAARHGEHDIAFGNIIGSNLFNTLGVVGLAGVIHPMSVPAEVFTRDITVMVVLTLSLFILGFGYKRNGRINRFEGALLLASFIGYTAYLVSTVF